MALGSANGRGGLAHGYSLATQAELSAVETGDLTTGDLAYVAAAVVDTGTDYHYWYLDREKTGSLTTDRIILSKDAGGSTAKPGRWVLSDVHMLA